MVSFTLTFILQVKENDSKYHDVAPLSAMFSVKPTKGEAMEGIADMNARGGGNPKKIG